MLLMFLFSHVKIKNGESNIICNKINLYILFIKCLPYIFCSSYTCMLESIFNSCHKFNVNVFFLTNAEPAMKHMKNLCQRRKKQIPKQQDSGFCWKEKTSKFDLLSDAHYRKKLVKLNMEML